MTFGLLGGKLGHSYSPQIHAALGNYEYLLFEKQPETLEDFLKNGDFSGLNVTTPYKKAVIPYLSELSPIAQRLGAVNTIVRRPDGSLIGHNTDYFGFQCMVERSGVQVANKKALVLGSGGASNTVVAVLQEMGARVIVISRNGSDNYQNLHRHKDAAIIVNTTPVGMYPHTGVAAVDVQDFPCLEGVLDVIYNPAETKLLLDAKRLGIPTMNGLRMLVAQAKESSEWFTGHHISDEIIDRIHKTLSLQMKNIALIGMPGSGKSTIGKLLAHQTGKTFVDADEKIEEVAGKTIPEIFAQDGEAEFRRIEAQVLAELGKQSGLVIATGGGCVTIPENYPSLHQNSIVIWVQRDIQQLPTAGRPLSQAGNLAQMYHIRRPLYERFADLSVMNDLTPDATVADILRILEETT